MDRTNKLEKLRKRNNLSQEDVYIRMGISGYDKTIKNISKYETGEQQMSLLTATMYAQSVGATLDEIAYLLYPEQPYHGLHGSDHSMDEIKIKTLPQKKSDRKDMPEHTCIIGSHADGVSIKGIIPAIGIAIGKGENILYFGDGTIASQIAEVHPEYKVYISKFPYDKLGILPNKVSAGDIIALINHVSDITEVLGVGDEYFRDINNEVLYKVISHMIERNMDINLMTILEELNRLDSCDYIENADERRILFMESRGLRNIIAYLYMQGMGNRSENADKISADEVCREKHIIIIDDELLAAESAVNAALFLVQYLKQVNEKQIKTSIIIEEAKPLLKHIPYNSLLSYLKEDKFETWTMAIPSIEVLQNIYGGDVSELMLCFANIHATLRHMSMNTEKFLRNKIGTPTLDGEDS